jgi:hypothetical protein
LVQSILEQGDHASPSDGRGDPTIVKPSIASS